MDILEIGAGICCTIDYNLWLYGERDKSEATNEAALKYFMYNEV